MQSQLRTTDGAQLWGNGNVIADRYGMSVVRDTLTLTGAEPPVPYYQPISERQYRIVNGTTVHGGLGGTSITTTGSGSVDNQILLLAQQVAGQDSQLFLMAQQDTLTSEVRLSANDGAANGSYLALTNVPSIPANGSITVDGPKVLIKPITTIGSLNAPAATLDVYRGLSGNGTAMFRGTTHNSHFNYGSTEDTYLRGGKTDAAIYLNDSHTGPVYVGASAFVPAVSKLRVHASVVVGNALNNDSLAATFAAGTGAGNAVGLSVRPYRIVAGSDWTGVSMILQRFTDTTYQTPYLSFSPTGGRIGLNVLNPSYEFQLSSDSAGKPGSSTWTVVSDARTKHAATRPFGLGLDWLRGVSPVYFAYNGLAGTPTDGEYLGVIAQDAPAEMVRRTRGRLRVEDAEETEILGTSLDPVVYALRNAVLELAERLTRVERIRTP